MGAMAGIYYTLIKKNVKKIEDVPEAHKKEVQAMLDAETAN